MAASSVTGAATPTAFCLSAAGSPVFGRSTRRSTVAVTVGGGDDGGGGVRSNQAAVAGSWPDRGCFGSRCFKEAIPSAYSSLSSCSSSWWQGGRPLADRRRRSVLGSRGRGETQLGMQQTTEEWSSSTHEWRGTGTRGFDDVDSWSSSPKAWAEEEESAAISRAQFSAIRLEELVNAGKPFAAPRTTDRMRRACGDPKFFGDLRRTFVGQRKKFLTHEEEMELGERVQRYIPLLEDQECLEKSLGRKPSHEEILAGSGLAEEEYRTIMTDGMEARQRLVVANLALVVSLSNKYKRGTRDCVCLQTLIQEGTIGLIRAAERYDPSKGFRFTTYAIWWIEAKLRVSVQTEERLIHVPMWVKNKHKVVSKSIAPLRDTLGREPTSAELADQVFIDTNSKMSVTPERVRQLKYWVALQRQQVSLDVNLKQSNSSGDETFSKQSVSSSLAADDPSAEVTSETEILRKFLESCMAQDLTNVQKEIVRMRVGLGGAKRSTRKEISRTLSISVKDVVHQERKAFTKLGIFRSRGGSSVLAGKSAAWRDFN